MSSGLRQLGEWPNAYLVDPTVADISRSAPAPRLVTVETETKRLTFDANKAIVIVIDMQNDFCHVDGWLSACIGVDVKPTREPIAPLKRALPEFRAAGVPVMWLNWGNRRDMANLSAGLRHTFNPTGAGVGIGDKMRNGSRVLMAGSWGSSIVDDLKPEPADIHIDKYRMSGFWDTPLDSVLRNMGKSTLLFAGVNADQCVMTTLQDAHFHGYDCILLRDCSGTASPSYCMEATLYNVSQCFGFVAQSTDVVGALAVAETGTVVKRQRTDGSPEG